MREARSRFACSPSKAGERSIGKLAFQLAVLLEFRRGGTVVSTRVQLRIKWAGTTPGLEQHRLDVDEFGAAITLLSRALKRVASAMVTEAEDPEYGARGGRRARRARELKVQWSSMKDGCVHSTFDVLMNGQQDMFGGLPERTVRRFVEHVRAEAAGHRRSAVVRKFLEALPDGLQAQTYEAVVGDQVVDSITVSTVTLAPPPRQLPGLFRGEAEIVGAFFDERRRGIELRYDNHNERLAADNEMVNRALGMRDQRVRFVALRSPAGSNRLLRLAPVDAPRPNADAVDDHLAARWANVLERLGEGPR